MNCSHCQAPNPETASRCSRCGRELEIRRGVVLEGRYEILETLGSGGMGVVFKAHDRELDEIVALKVLRAEVASDPAMAARFRSEIKLARKVRHPNVCAIHEYGQSGATRFIVMEYVGGSDLRHTLRESGALPAPEVVDVALQLSAGLEAIHAQGIVHRDLKTANVMRAPNGVLRLMDFGIAKRVEGAADAGATAVGLMVGTPDYMSPEQVRGETVDRRSDLYSLGIVLFELLTGERPFRADSAFGIVLKQINEPPPLDGPLAARIPQPLVDLLRRLLAKDRGERFSSAAELIAALQEVRSRLEPAVEPPFGAGTASTAAPPGTLSTPRTTLQPPPRSFPSPALLLGGGLAALLVVVAATAWLGWWVVTEGRVPVALGGLAPGERTPQTPSTTTPSPPAASRALTPPTTAPSLPAPAPEQQEPAPAEQERLHRDRVAQAGRLVESGGYALRRARAGGDAAALGEALAAFRRALELDPSNQEARRALAEATALPPRSATRAAAAPASPAQPTAGAASPRTASASALISFEQDDTRYGDPTDSSPPGFRANSGGQVRSTQAHIPKAQLFIELDPREIRPGDAYAVRYFLFNSAASPLAIARVAIRRSAGSAVTGGPVEPLARTAPPRTRTLLKETTDTWSWDPATQWLTSLEVVLDDGSTYGTTLRARSVSR